MLGAGAVRNRTYRRGRTVSCASLVSIKFLANRPFTDKKEVVDNLAFSGYFYMGVERMLQPNDSLQASDSEDSHAARLQPMGFGDILDNMFSLYRNHFRLFVTICSVYLVYGFVTDLLIGISTVYASNSGEFGTLMLVSVAFEFIGAVVMLFVISAIVFGSAEAFLGREITASAAFKRTETQILAVRREQFSLRFGCRTIDDNLPRHSVSYLFCISLDFLQPGSRI